MAFIGRHGRWCLVLGLAGGLTLPSVTLAIKPWLPALITALLFVSALRIGPKAALGRLSDIRQTIVLALIYQFAAPLLALAVLGMAGVLNTTAGLVVVLVLAAPSVTGAPNFTIMMKRDPAPSLRLLLVGTAIFPFTVIPVFLALPIIPTVSGVIESALRLLLVIMLSVGLAFAIRRNKTLTDSQFQALDGMAAILLGAVVIGLMSAINPTFQSNPESLALWLMFTFTLNFGLQLLAHRTLRGDLTDRTSVSIIAGNRNIALFLVALPEDVVAQFLVFIGCYQVPMYLTPMVMKRWLARDP